MYTRYNNHRATLVHHGIQQSVPVRLILSLLLLFFIFYLFVCFTLLYWLFTLRATYVHAFTFLSMRSIVKLFAFFLPVVIVVHLECYIRRYVHLLVHVLLLCVCFFDCCPFTWSATSVHPFTSLFICLFVCLFVCSLLWLFTLSATSVHPFTSLFFVCLFPVVVVYLKCYISPPIHLFVNVCLFICARFCCCLP